MQPDDLVKSVSFSIFREHISRIAVIIGVYSRKLSPTHLGRCSFMALVEVANTMLGRDHYSLPGNEVVRKALGFRWVCSLLCLAKHSTN